MKEQPADAGHANGLAQELPLPDYGELTVARLLPRLSSLTESQLRRVRDYERRHANRTPVIDAVDRMLG